MSVANQRAMGEPWLTHKAWAMRRYGKPVFRVPLDPGWGCPNRTAEGRGGCTFCGEDGARARQLGDAATVEEQVSRGLAFARERYGGELFQLYVQAYTATHASVEALRALVEPQLERAEFVSISLGTRPDCLPEEMLELLREWRREREVWVELGVQSTREETLRRVRRRHGWEESRRALRELRAAGILRCAHLLFGLPGEGADEMLESVEALVAEDTDGYKLHNLHVLRDSALGRRWLKAPFPVLEEEAYLEFVMLALRRIPADRPVFRVCTDSAPEQRLAPAVRYPKGRFLAELARRMRERGWRQGDGVGAAFRA